MRFTTVHKSRIRKRLVHGRLRFIAGPSYALLVELELAAQRAIDAVRPLPTAEPELLGQLTAVVKTFERPKCLKRLVRSIKRLFPDLHIIVVDDSQNPVELPDVTTITLPYDSGVSAGRREGLRRVSTRYMLNLDDDFVFYRQTDLQAALALMEQHHQIDIMGGTVISLPLFSSSDYSRGSLFPTTAESTMPADSRVGGLPVYDKVPNFFVGRTDRVRLVNWDPGLKRMDHADFFTRAKGILTSVFNPNLKCMHAQDPFDMAYLAKRTDYSVDGITLQQWYLDQR